MGNRSRRDERLAAVRFTLIVVGWLTCLLVWASVLSFDVADPPSTTVWPNRSPPYNLCGVPGAAVAYYLFYYLGIATYPLLGLLSLALIAWSRGARVGELWLRFVGLLLVCAVSSTLATLFLGSYEHYPVSGSGGLIGSGLAALLRSHLQPVGIWLLLSASLVAGLLLAADNLLLGLFRLLRWAGQSRPAASTRAPAPSPGSKSGAEAKPLSNSSERAVMPRPVPARKDSGDPVPSQASQPTSTPPPAIQAAVTEIGPPAPKPTRPARPQRRDDDYELPPLSLLSRGVQIDRAALEAACREKAYVLEQTLNEFRLAVEVVAIETGPVITVFELKLAPGIKVSQIASLANDMARALKAPAVRVVAPLPGKSTIGIEVPNLDKEKVRLRDVMEMSVARVEHMAIPLFLGKDASGQALTADLTRMPHLLIAGTTGSGKSVCINSLIMSILMTRSPSEVNLILLDPKVVELAAYREIPHLISPIVTEVSKAEAILDWASTKMDERYALLAEAGVKDIRGYNRLGPDELRRRLQPASDQEMEQIPLQLPYIVIMIDELADLMMTSAKEVEFYLCRIAQKSRAVGIHLIVSTQRPQANVVTGLIKSNLPCRIAFRVSSRLDSRIVLDQNGGEVLMGQGDMLFLPPGSSKLVRAQGTFVDDEELRAVVRHCREQRAPEFHPELAGLPAQSTDVNSQRDELFDQAVEAIIQSQRGSVSLLQRRFNIGYGRASRLIDQMCAAGIVGPYKGSQAREVLMTKEEWEAARRQRDREEAQEAGELPAQ